jgi:hypothetical protein
MLSLIGIILYRISLLAFVISLGGIFYQHIVEYRNWHSNIPDSLNAYRQFFKVSEFGDFFKIFMPTAGLCLIIAMIINWNSWMIISLAGMFLTAGFTNWYFVPIHKKLFEDEMGDTAELKRNADRWRKGNYTRMIIMGITTAAMIEGLF